VAQQPNSGLDSFTIEVSRSHALRLTHAHSRDPLRERSVGEDATTYTAHNKHKRRTSMLLTGFEPAVPATERSQIFSLGRTTTGAGLMKLSSDSFLHMKLNITKCEKILCEYLAKFQRNFIERYCTETGSFYCYRK
jgi:hypothetical protein